MLTDHERTKVAEALLAVIFSLRPDSGEVGQAWTLTIATTAMTRAILASVGPQGDATDLLKVAHDHIATAVADAQSKFFRDKLTAVPGGRADS